MLTTAKPFVDVEVTANRTDDAGLTVTVTASPVGSDAAPTPTPLSLARSAELADLCSRRVLALPEAMAVGRELSTALLPPRVYERVYHSMTAARAARAPGVRLRLRLDDSLTALPWELLYRPELSAREAVSGFLALDPFVSIVRGARHAPPRREPATSQRRLLFLGAVHRRQGDIFEIAKEFAALRTETKPLGDLLVPLMLTADDILGMMTALAIDTPVVHYSGNAFVDDEGRGHLVAHAQESVDGHETGRLGVRLATAGVQLLVMTATESHHHAIVGPILRAGVGAVIAVNGPDLTNEASIAFTGALYRGLAAGFSVDSAVVFARQSMAAPSLREGRVEWGQFVLHLAGDEVVPFPTRADLPAVRTVGRAARRAGSQVEALVADLDGDDYGALLSSLSERSVLILGRFTEQRRRVLDAIKAHLKAHAAGYEPVLFTFAKPPTRDLIESIRWFAGLSRFIIADLSEPKSLPAELAAIVPDCPSVPVVAIASEATGEYAVFSHIKRFRSVSREIVRYREEADLIARIDQEVVAAAETLRTTLLEDA